MNTLWLTPERQKLVHFICFHKNGSRSWRMLYDSSLISSLLIPIDFSHTLFSSLPNLYLCVPLVLVPSYFNIRPRKVCEDGVTGELKLNSVWNVKWIYWLLWSLRTTIPNHCQIEHCMAAGRSVHSLGVWIKARKHFPAVWNISRYLPGHQDWWSVNKLGKKNGRVWESSWWELWPCLCFFQSDKWGGPLAQHAFSLSGYY